MSEHVYTTNSDGTTKSRPHYQHTLYARSSDPTKAENRARSGRGYRRQHNWNKANQPKFGAVNGWYVEPKEIVVNRRRLMYG